MRFLKNLAHWLLKDTAVISGERDVHVESSVIITGGSTVHGDVTVERNTVVFAPRIALMHAKPRAATQRDELRWKQVEQIMPRAGTPENKRQLLKIYAETNDETLKIRVALILGPWFMPTDDTLFQLLEITDETIFLARMRNEKSALAALLAYKAKYLVFLWAQENQSYNYALVREEGLGISMKAWIEREMSYKDNRSQKCFDEAEKEAEESGDYQSEVAVCLEKAMAAEQMAMNLVVGDIPRRLEKREEMKAAYRKAEQVYLRVADQLASGGEWEIANVHHNLANSLRNFASEDTIREAKELEARVIPIAKKHGDRHLLAKTEMLMRRLNGEPIPDYANGADDTTM